MQSKMCTDYMQLKAISLSISSDIQSREKIISPLTPKNICESNGFLDLHKQLFNLITWTVSPNAAVGKNVFDIID